MKTLLLAGVLIALSFTAAPVLAADDPDVASLATCKESWFDWHATDLARWNNFGNHLRADFSPHGNDPYWLPKTEKSILGLRVTQVFPESVGMGVGFSVTVDAPFDKTRKIVEKALGKPLGKCETGDGMRMCELDIAEKRDFTLMAEDSPKSMQTLVGCYYFYEK